MNFKLKLFFISIIFLITSCDKKSATSSDNSATVYYNGDILTMAGDTPDYVEAIVVKDGRIEFVGASDKAMETAGAGHKMIDLKGKTLIPGFIDAHSHIWQTAQKLGTVNLDPKPAGDITSIQDITKKLNNELTENPSDYNTDNKWLIGWGFDNAMLSENRFPTSEDLDKVSTTTPIVLVHFSGHIIVMNSKGLERSGYLDNGYKIPDGGSLRYFENSKKPNGIIEEQAMLTGMNRIGEDITGVKGIYAGIEFPKDKMKELVLKAQQEYIEAGYTTLTEFATTDSTYDVIKELGNNNQLKVDFGLAFYSALTTPERVKSLYSKNYTNKVRVIGGKLNLDGGSPGRTAFLREKYYTPTVGQPDDYRGYSSISKQEEMNNLVASYYKEKIPFFIHALGDAALDQCIEAVSYAETNNGYKDARTNLIHLQIVQPDQIEKLKTLDVTATFQITHNFYFADFHEKYIYGPERTKRLNPMKETLEADIPVTFHHDSPIHPIDQLHIMWIAVNRASRSGKVYGPENRLSPYEALYASTAAAAYQYFEENEKGSLAEGKLADLVILDKNPLKVDPMSIKDIKVLETIKEGKTIFTKE